MVDFSVSDITLKQIVDDKCICIKDIQNEDNFKHLYTSEYGERKTEDSRTLFARQDKEIKEMIYKAGKADGIANFLVLACDEVDEVSREKLIKIAEMLKKEI